MDNFILRFSRKLGNSSRYQEVKSFFCSLLEDVNYRYKKYFDGFMIGLIVISITILIMNKSGKIPDWLMEFDLYFITSIFVLEYILRLWIRDDKHTQNNHPFSSSRCEIAPFKDKLRYIVSLPAIIDLIAIFPKFRIIRLLKLYRYTHGASSLFDALIQKRFEFIFLGYMLLGITFTFGSIFYLLEYGINEKVDSYLDAIYWALVTISTVGYGDIAPVTDLGKVVSMFSILFGIAMISFATSVMVSAFSERFDKLRNQDSINYVNKMDNIVIINGYGHLGETIAGKLKEGKIYEPVIVEKDAIKANRALENGYKVIREEGSSAKLIKELYQRDNIAAMLTLTSSDIDNIYFILNAKSVYAKSVVYTRMNHVERKAQYVATKVDGIIEPYHAVDIKAFNCLKKLSEGGTKNITFLGYTRKSKDICKRLRVAGIDVTIYELDHLRYQAAKEDGFHHIILMDKKSSEVSDIKDGIAVCGMKEEEINVYYSITLRAKGFTGEIVALSDSKEDNRKLSLAGASKIFDMYEEGATQFIEKIERNKKEKT